jgi:glutathione S-transferase
MVALWNDCLKSSGGPFLFGARPCIADAMFASAVTRFHTYSIPAAGAAQRYVESVWAWPILQEWVAAARAETLRAKFHE